MNTNPESPKEVRARRLAYIKKHLRCPYCEAKLEKWDCPDSPLAAFNTEFIYVCVNRECSYFLGSLEDNESSGAMGGAYCLVYDPSRGWFGPMPARGGPASRG